MKLGRKEDYNVEVCMHIVKGALLTIFEKVTVTGLRFSFEKYFVIISPPKPFRGN
jgi:hypothetical protein